MERRTCSNDVPNIERPSVRNLSSANRVLDWCRSYFAFDKIKEDPFDNIILKAHYSFTPQLLFAFFFYTTSHWYADEPIFCLDQSDRSEPPEDLLDICLSYPYKEKLLKNNDKVRIYALYYRWVHISCLFLAFFYKSFILIRRMLRLKKIRSFIKKMNKIEYVQRYWIAKQYYKENKGLHSFVYVKYILLHVAALVINAIAFNGVNITLQNYYWDLPKQLIVKRDPSNFQDDFSLIFPPFAMCEITHEHHILNERTKRFGCHLKLMQLYEKVFMIFWFWQIFLAVITLLYIIYIIPLPCCDWWTKGLIVRGGYAASKQFQSCVQNLNIDELFAVGVCKRLLLSNDYKKILLFHVHPKSKSQESLNPNDTVYYDSNELNDDDIDFIDEDLDCNGKNPTASAPLYSQYNHPEAPLPCQNSSGDSVPIGIFSTASTVQIGHSVQNYLGENSISIGFDVKTLHNSTSVESKLHSLSNIISNNNISYPVRGDNYNSQIYHTPKTGSDEENWDEET